jgi:hypothetical protein
LSTLDCRALREGLNRRLPAWRWRDDLKGREDDGIVQRDEAWRGVRLRGLQLGDSGDPLVRRQRGRCLRLRGVAHLLRRASGAQAVETEWGRSIASTTLDTCSRAFPARQEEAAALIAGLVFD